MRAAPSFDRKLLGGMSPDTFLAQYWQRKPLLVRQAVRPVPTMPDRRRLIALAARDDVESRLIRGEGERWAMVHGPLRSVPRGREWTLLVQGVNLHDASADALMRRFDFVSAMRLDDLMISIAADGGGVGPHLDSYDVFLVQLEGRRRWRWSQRPATTERERALVADAPLKRLAHFAPTDEAVLEPGDLLYLPPACAHDGVAIGNCTTASIGFRMPSWRELEQEFLFAMAEREVADGMHRDLKRTATATPAALDADLLAAITTRLSSLRFTKSDVVEFVGRHFTEPKPHVSFDPPPRSSAASPARFAARAARHGLRVDPRATLLYRRRRLWIAGEAHELPGGGTAAWRRLADRRRLDAPTVEQLVADPESLALLHDWWSAGWLLLDTSARRSGTTATSHR